MKIQLKKDHDRFGVNSVIDVDQPTGARLVAEGIGIEVDADTRARKYTSGAALENLCIPVNNDNTTITAPPQFIAAIDAEMTDTKPKASAKASFFTSKK